MLLRPVESAQFTSWAFTRRAIDSGLLPSMGSIGDCFDNAMIESFWSRMQVELLDRQRWKTRIELANAIFETSKSSTTVNDATPRLACLHPSSSRLDTNQQRQRESTNPPPQNPGRFKIRQILVHQPEPTGAVTSQTPTNIALIDEQSRIRHRHICNADRTSTQAFPKKNNHKDTKETTHWPVNRQLPTRPTD